MEMSFSAFVDVYFSDKSNRLKERSIKNKRYMIESKILPFFDNESMNMIRSFDIIQWQNEMLS